jgi:metal-responsive CopG/Arc/MetJ family transcriptional regulator
MARVLISLPDNLLARLDARASERQMTRNRLIRVLVEQEVRARALRRR